MVKPCAIIERPNYPAGGNAGSVLQFAIERRRPGVPQPAC
jgi:hypothetical protein